jgi:methyl-accepting chemotaxis protein
VKYHLCHGEITLQPECLGHLKKYQLMIQSCGRPGASGCNAPALTAQRIKNRYKAGWETRLFPLQLTSSLLPRTIYWRLCSALPGLLSPCCPIYLTSSRLSKPLAQLGAITDSVAGGDVSQEIRIDRQDEVGALARAQTTHRLPSLRSLPA